MNPQGLSEAEVAQSAKRFGSNAQPEEKSSRVALQLWGVVKEPMMLLLVMAAIISAALGDPLESGALLISVFLVILISLIQVRRTDKALASLKLMSTPKATVYRDGELRQVLSRDLVVGDVLLLTEGDRLPADCRILESSNFLVDESIMTGESVPVEKRVEDVGLSGTLAIRGHAIAVIVEVGATSQIGQIGQMLSGGDKRTILQREVDRIVKVVSIAALATALTVTLVYFFTRGDFLVGLLAGVAAAMALLPEELPIVLTIFFGVGALRMARSKVIVKNNPAIEMLGQIDVLCVDKTGTITLNELTLISKDPQILLFGSLASIPTSFDPIDRAFLKETSVPEGFTLIREFPLTDESLIFCQIWQDTKGAFLAAIKGAPERVIELCRLSGDERVTTEKDLREVPGWGYVFWELQRR